MPPFCFIIKCILKDNKKCQINNFIDKLCHRFYTIIYKAIGQREVNMKLFKKIMAGVLSLAVVAGVMVVFSGCNNVKGKTYAFESRTYTIIVAVDPSDNTKITETRTLSSKEYWLAFVSDRKVALADLAAATMTEAEEKLYSDWMAEETEVEANTVYEFSKKTVDKIVTELDEISGEKELTVYRAEYKTEEDVISIKNLVSTNEQNNYFKYFVGSLYVLDNKIEERAYKITATTDYAVNKVLYISNYYAEI